VRKHASLVLGAALLTLSVFAAGSPAGASGSGGARKPAVESGYHFWKTHGYLPVDGVASFYRQKAAGSASWVRRGCVRCGYRWLRSSSLRSP